MTSISVIMPVFNAQKTAAKAVSSLLRALPDDGEFLILDDGSSDDSCVILRQLAARDQRIVLLESLENRGVGPSLQSLLNAASGSYVARMDADDICLPWRFSYMRRFLSQRNVDVGFSTCVVLGKYAVPRPQRPQSLMTDVARHALILSNPFVHSTLLARTDVLKGLGGYRRAVAEDYDLWLRAAEGGARVARAALPTIIYRKHESQVTASGDWSVRREADVLTAASHKRLVYELYGEVPYSFAELRRSGSGEVALENETLRRKVSDALSNLRSSRRA